MIGKHPSYLGFSSGSGSFRPSPTGLFSASSPVRRCSSASTFPCKDKKQYEWCGFTLLPKAKMSNSFYNKVTYKGLTTHLILEICYETVCFTACISITKMSHSLFRTIISGGALVWLTVSSNSSSSFLATKGHQPLILFCLKMETMGISPSFVTISMVHCLGVLAPRGKRFKSSSIAPMKTFFLQ